MYFSILQSPRKMYLIFVMMPDKPSKTESVSIIWSSACIFKKENSRILSSLAEPMWYQSLLCRILQVLSPPSSAFYLFLSSSKRPWKRRCETQSRLLLSKSSVRRRSLFIAMFDHLHAGYFFLFLGFFLHIYGGFCL